MEKRRDLPLIPPNMEKEERVRELIERIGIEKYSEEEKKQFDEWKKNIPFSSVESPLKNKTVDDIFCMLPESPNYTKDETGFYFEITNDSHAHVDAVFERFVKERGTYEIAAQKINDSVFYLTIGGRTHGVGKKSSGTFYAHSHPEILDVFELNEEKQKNLPYLFKKGVLPSIGDVEIYLRKGIVGEEGSKIFSKNGFSEVRNEEEISPVVVRENLKKYRDAYFDLLDGKNNIGFKDLEETKDYFKKQFGIDLQYHEFKNVS